MSALIPQIPAHADVSRAVRSLRSESHPIVLGYHPVARMNPFQSLLYRNAYDQGFAAVPLVGLDEIPSLRTATSMGALPVLHIHWTADVLRSAGSTHEARAAKDRYLGVLESMRSEGVRLVWTVHNVLPHGCPHPGVEAELRASLASMCDVVHIMNPRTMDFTADHYPIPDDRVMSVPHPSYNGAYPKHFEKRMVRFEIGFEPSDLVVGILGSIQPYKGIGRFLDALETARLKEPRLRGLVAGIPGGDVGSVELIQRLERDETVLSVPRRLDDTTLSRLLTALDLLVLPYDASLNSGAALLGLAFGRPILAPRVGQFDVLESLGLCVVYDPSDPGALASSLGEASAIVAEHDPGRAAGYCAASDATIVSTAFFQGLRERISP
ncbi:MAG: hypothetical protein OEX04_09585 [Acidimicrobiia bacterium]|nr:hypothetical protein [Acidimicrobiia bacterium]MDH4307718.1 hypothetical protein [Acidimicrobiia bacterium]